ncbi:hypothetical protein BDZ89DRAFT_1036318 [Hymenopellis radicata]|nr:hypothetical protein BDZ89DRAFT_1036318 [Hymenopellis radicata]
MEGRRLIIQMVVGGKTQYLTKVQGMPKEVEQKLERRIRRFLWADKRAYSYLNIGKDRALWAYFADAVIAKHAVEYNAGHEEFTRMNIFLQNFRTNTEKLPDDLRRILKAGKDHGVRREGLTFKRETLRDMPIWLHRGIDTKTSSAHINQNESPPFGCDQRIMSFELTSR